MRLPVYLDHHATTPLDPRVLDVVTTCLRDDFGNASSTDHLIGARASNLVEEAREKVARLIRARSDEIVFTSGATESDNLAIRGLASVEPKGPTHFVTTRIEHEAVLDVFRALEVQGANVSYLPVDRAGLVASEDLDSAVREETKLVSIMLANNEVGTIQQIDELAKITHKSGALLHVDAAQAVGHIPVDVEELDVDLLSFSAHKAYGPKGVGGLFVRRRRRRVELEPLILGGGQERGMRSGTLNVPGIVGMGEAFTIASRELAREGNRVAKLRNELESRLEELGGTVVNGHRTRRLPHNLNVTITGVDGKALISSLRSSVAFSASSACSTQSVEPSHVLLALGLTPDEAHMSVRFGLGRGTSQEEIDFASAALSKAVRKLRSMKGPRLASN
jgi:cysteine desulfurase